MAEPYSTVFDPTRDLDNVLRLGYDTEALGVLSGAPIRWGKQPSGISGGARDSGERNILKIQNILETAADPGPWDTLKGYLRVPGTGDRIIPTAEDRLNMARMNLAMPGTPGYGQSGIEQQSARQILPVMEEMINQPGGYSQTYLDRYGGTVPGAWDAFVDPVTRAEQRYLAPTHLFESGNFDLGSPEAMKAHPFGWNRPDQGDYTGTSYYYTYSGGGDTRP